MKKLIALASICMAGAAFAAVTIEATKNTAGVAYTTVATSSQYTILAVPYGNAAASGDIDVKDLVSTTGLTSTDSASSADDAARLWVLPKGSASTSNYTVYYNKSGVWTPVDETVTSTTVAAGDAIWLVLPDGTASANAYVKGAVVSSGATAVQTGFNLLGSVSLSSYSVKDALTAHNVTSARVSRKVVDKVLVYNGSTTATYTYTGTSGMWYTPTFETSDLSDVTIPAGQGFWYYKAGN